MSNPVLSEQWAGWFIWAFSFLDSYDFLRMASLWPPSLIRVRLQPNTGSQKGFTACTWPFVKAANIVASSDFFMPGRSDKQAEGTQKKRNRLEAGGFFVLLSKTTYICDGTGLNNLLWAEVLKFILFRISIPFFFLTNETLICGKKTPNLETCQQSYGSWICAVSSTLEIFW